MNLRHYITAFAVLSVAAALPATAQAQEQSGSQDQQQTTQTQQRQQAQQQENERIRMEGGSDQQNRPLVNPNQASGQQQQGRQQASNSALSGSIVQGQLMSIREQQPSAAQPGQSPSLIADVRTREGKVETINLGSPQNLDQKFRDLAQGRWIAASGQMQQQNGQQVLMAKQIAIVAEIKRQNDPQQQQGRQQGQSQQGQQMGQPRSSTDQPSQPQPRFGESR